MSNNKYVIIVAGGSGKRMKQSLPKQFLCIHEFPIIFHTINRFVEYDPNINIIVALQEEYHDYWSELVVKYDFSVSCQIVNAGKERFFTVQNALIAIDKADGIVAVHDAVRPMVDNNVIKSCFNAVKPNLGVIPSIDLIDSIRKTTDSGSEFCDRKQYKAVQTPQCFCLDELKEVYKTAFKEFFTDDASVWEFKNKNILMVDGNTENIKITSTMDLITAEFILSKK